MTGNLTIGVDTRQDYKLAYQRIVAAYQVMIELARDPVFIVSSPEGIVLEVNRECTELLGFEEHELRGMNVSDFMCDLLVALTNNESGAGAENEALFKHETKWRHRDGDEIPVQVNMQRIDAPGGSFYIIFAHDIHELKATKKALRESDKHYNDLVENSGEGLGVVDTEEHFLFANPAACEIFGLPSDELFGKNLLSFLDPHSIEEIKHQTALRKEGQKSIYEIEIIRPDGERRWIIVTATPQYDEERKLTGTLGIFRDITERKLAETRLRESEQRLHEIVDLTNDWIWEIDPEWKYSFVSPKIFDILGYQPEDMIGRSPFDFLVPGDVVQVKEGVRSMVHQYKPLNAIVNRAVHKDGHLVYLETSGIAMFNEQGKYMGYRGADRDVTLRKLYERELIVAKEKAEESDRLKSSILSNMSHELRTPLNGILGFAEILLEELRETDYESMVDNIYNSGKRLMSTLNSIIMLSQLESGKIKVSGKLIQLEPSISSIVKSLASISAEKNIYINTEGVRQYPVSTDDLLFTQLVYQILDNAVKFTDQGGITIETREVTEPGKSWVVIQITDTGIGIDKTFYELIFQEFRQISEGFGRKYQGSGIGLTISKKIIDLLGGQITIESEPGKGSCFSIWLPGVQDVVQAPELLTSAGMVQQDRVNGLSEVLPKVLLVEDNLVNKELTMLFLRSTCMVEHAADADAALAMARSEQYQVILMDINLGYGMNGIEATREIRQIPGYEFTPIIAVTGYTMAEDTEQLYAAGCTSHIAKPFDKSNLIKMVKEVLRKG